MKIARCDGMASKTFSATCGGPVKITLNNAFNIGMYVSISVADWKSSNHRHIRIRILRKFHRTAALEDPVVVTHGLVSHDAPICGINIWICLFHELSKEKSRLITIDTWHNAVEMTNPIHRREPIVSRLMFKSGEFLF
jgi:hypothetical protein